MMYTPDRWVVIEIENRKEGDSHFGEKHRRVFAGWYGGYLNGDSWKMNSGITEVIDRGDHYEFKGESGSSYFCYKQAYGMSNYMHSVLTNFQESPDLEIAIVEEYEPKDGP